VIRTLAQALVIVAAFLVVVAEVQRHEATESQTMEIAP
jgi:hypothetical protein